MVAANSKAEQWLNCRVDEGMFSNEVAVTYPAEGKVLRSVFVPATAVRGEAGKTGYVQVVVLRKPGKTLAILPTANRDILAVAEKDISESP
jgi:hypothetical protein